MPSYTNTSVTPTGLNYLSGDIMPWDDYYIFATANDHMIAIYGTCDSVGHFDTATIRECYRQSGTGNRPWLTSERTETSVSVSVPYPYYCYGNVIGQPIELISSYQITCSMICGAIVIIAVTRVWSLFRGLRRCFKHE